MQHDAVPLYPQPQDYTKVQVIPKDNTMNQQPSSVLGPQKTQNSQQMVLLGPSNTVTVCPFCNASIKSSVKYTTNTRTHIAAALCCIACCCCCIPYSSDSAKNADHYCPNCQRYIGTYHR